jgi:integrase
MANATHKGWSYVTGEKSKNRVRAYEKSGKILLEFYERTSPSDKPIKKRVSLSHGDRELAKLKAEELAAALRRGEAPQTSPLTLHALFYNCYLKEMTPTKSKGKQRHDATCAEMFCRCFGAGRQPRTLNVRDWQKFIRERKSGALRPLSRSGDPITPVGDQQVRYDLKFLVAVLNFATVARDDKDVPLLTHNPLKGLPFPVEVSPCRPMLSEEHYLAMYAVAPLVHSLFPAFLQLVHETGHRASSVRQLRWSDLDLQNELVNWPAETDKMGFSHETPLSPEVVGTLVALLRCQRTVGQCWVFPSDKDPTKPVPRRTALKWWARAEKLAKLDHRQGEGFHSARRKFATEMKPNTNLRDLAYMGGWKNPQTLLTAYQLPEVSVQREALAARTKMRASRDASPTDTTNGHQEDSRPTA